MDKKQAAQFDFENFKGFTSPQYTPVPDLLFDHIMQELNESELKVMLYIIRRTFGFKRDTDNISLNQLADGITTKDGRILDRGVGLNRRSVARALASLREKNLIVANRRRDPKRGNLPTTYSLKMQATPSDSSDTPPSDSRVTTLVTPESPTINSNTINSTTTKSLKTTAAKKKENNNSSSKPPPKQDVVVALTEKGISQKVAQRLASRYKEPRIREKVEFLEYLQENDSDQVSKSAPGWLRRAIEDDYAAPAGYAPDWRDQQAAEARSQEEAQRQRELWEEQRSAEEAEKQAQAIKTREEQLKPLKAYLRTSEAQEKTWSEIVSQATAIKPTDRQVYFLGSEYLGRNDNQFIIWAPNKMAAETIYSRYGLTIAKMLAKQHQISLKDIQLTYLYPNAPQIKDILETARSP